MRSICRRQVSVRSRPIRSCSGRPTPVCSRSASSPIAWPLAAARRRSPSSLADQAIGQADQRLAIELLGQQLLLESALLGDVLGGTENAHDQLAFVVPLRPARVAQPVAGAVPALDPILDARRLACEQPLSAPLHDAQIRGLDQGRPAAQGLDLGRAVAGQALEGACGPIENQAAIGLGAQMIDAIGGQTGERIEAALEPLRRGYDAASARSRRAGEAGRADGRRRADDLHLEPDPAVGRAGDLQRQIDRALPLDRIDQPGDFLRLGSHRRQDVQRCPTRASAGRPIRRVKPELA